MGFQTEYDFTLPKGYSNSDGTLYREGKMRLATAADEIIPLKDPRVRKDSANDMSQYCYGSRYWYVRNLVMLPQNRFRRIGKEIMNHFLKFVADARRTGTKVTIGPMAAKAFNCRIKSDYME